MHYAKVWTRIQQWIIVGTVASLCHQQVHIAVCLYSSWLSAYQISFIWHFFHWNSPGMMLLLISGVKKETEKTSKGSIRNTLISCMLNVMQIITCIVHTEGWQYAQPFACCLQCRMLWHGAVKAAAMGLIYNHCMKYKERRLAQKILLAHLCWRHITSSVSTYCCYIIKTCNKELKTSNVKARALLSAPIKKQTINQENELSIEIHKKEN